MNHPKPIIKVLQYMYGDFEHFHWSEKINHLYCERHGYEHIISRETPRIDRHVCWHKIPTIMNELHDCDYLLFMDADANFYSHELRIEEELIPLMEHKNILMAQDFTCESERWTPGLPNSGVILMRNSRQTLLFFKTWDEASDIDESTRWNWPPEQLALWSIVLPKFPGMVHVHPDYYMIHGRYGQFIRHFCQESDQDRVAGMQAIWKRLSYSQETPNQLQTRNPDMTQDHMNHLLTIYSSRTGHGELRLNEVGYAALDLPESMIPEEYLILSAHCPSEIRVTFKTKIGIQGVMNGSSVWSPVASCLFLISDNIVGYLFGPKDKTREMILEPGYYTLEITSPEPNWKHSLWAIREISGD